jgi:PmbA protein
MIGTGKPRSRACPVVLDPTVAASFIAIVGRGLCASSVQRGRSPFAERLGTEVAGGGALVLHDDGLDPEGPASSPFDGEGVARRRTPLIEAGTLRNYLYDTYTARRGGVESTGNAGRAGYRSQPSAAASNLVVAPGASTLEDLFAKAGDGVLVTDVAGLHSGVNPISGDFSTGAEGLRIRGGELAEPVREFTIASTLQKMLKDVISVGSDLEWLPMSASGVSLVIDEVTISGV